ncbi:MAG: BamA/TamA family outer membrane protein [Ignavibacteria bacterium]|nr:BamA/TamA family outer membrane protein [Ignavibacteria bacterium]
MMIISMLAVSAFSQEDDGELFEIDNIEIVFLGTQSFETDNLLGIMALKEGDDFEKDIYLQDLERIKKFYFDNGFFDISVDTATQFISDSKEVNEKFTIKEGSRYKISKMNLDGLENVPENVMELILRPGDKIIYDGKYYSKDTIRLENSRILEILLNNGFALAASESPEVLKYETNVSTLENKVNLTLTFITGDIYNFGKTKISFRGEKYNITTNDVARELTYKEGELYSKDKIVKSEINLSKMSILENPRITFSEVDSVNHVIDLSLDIVVSNKYELTPEIFSYYFQNYLYIGGGISFSDKNFLGGGRVLTSGVRSYYNAPLNYRLEWINTIFQPFLFGNKNTSGSWNFGLKYISEETVNTSTITNYFNISYDLPTYTYINRIVGTWQTDYDNLTLKEDLLSEDSLLLKSFELNVLNSTLSLALVHNTVNNLQFPFKGNFQSYEFEESGLLSGLFEKVINSYTNSYFKFTNLNSFYFNLSNKDFNVPSALASKFYFGSIFEYGENNFFFYDEEISADRVPSDERFVCGGSSSIRGWGARQLGIVNDKDLGGNFIIESSVEHRLRPFLEASNVYFRDLGFATFVDVGNVWSEISKFKLNEIAIAAGAGIRYYTIVGAIRFDLGFKIYDPQPGSVGGSNWLFGSGAKFSDKYNFQFGIGNTF